MVAKTVAAPTTETQVQGDAGNQAADAAGSAEVKAYFDAQGKGSVKGVPESTEGEAPPAPEVDEFPELTEAKKAAAEATEERVARETTSRIEREAQERQAAVRATEAGKQFQANYAARVNNTRDEVLNALIGLNADPDQARAFAEKIAARLNEHHADGLKLYESEAVQAVSSAFNRDFNTGIAGVLDKDEALAFFGTTDKPASYPDTATAFKAFKAAVTKDMVTEKEATAREKTAVLKYHQWNVDNGRLVGTRSKPQAANGSGGGTGTTEPKDWNEVTQMVTGSHPSGRRLTTAESRVYAQRFGHKIPR